MQIHEFSRRQLETLVWWYPGSGHEGYDAVICDGAVRSGKTTIMGISFVTWAFYYFHDTSFAMCGKTISSMRRNIITPLVPQLRAIGMQCEEKISRNYLELHWGGRRKRQESEELLALAAEGRAWREELLEKALRAGALAVPGMERALLDDMCRDLPAAQLKSLCAAFEAQAAKALPLKPQLWSAAVREGNEGFKF